MSPSFRSVMVFTFETAKEREKAPKSTLKSLLDILVDLRFFIYNLIDTPLRLTAEVSLIIL